MRRGGEERGGGGGAKEGEEEASPPWKPNGNTCLGFRGFGERVGLMGLALVQHSHANQLNSLAEFANKKNLVSYQ